MQLILSLYFVLKLIVGPPIDVLVDPANALPSWYAPGENADARQALEDMITAASQEGLRVAIFSGYRSYEYQTRLYEREARQWPERVDEFIARPGYSEHQLGTTFDIAWPGLPVESMDERNLRLWAWVQKNAHHYGFVVSYPLRFIDEWPYTNRWMPVAADLIYEPWHVRYVGVELATEMVAAGYLDPESEVDPHDFYTPWP